MLSGHGGPALHLALSERDTNLAAASFDGRVRIHRLDRSRLLAALPFSQLPTGPSCNATQPITLGNAAPNDSMELTDIENAQIDGRYNAFLQFGSKDPSGGADRARMIQLAQALSARRWNVQGGDKGGECLENVTDDEVRFGPDTDRKAADLLAAQVGLVLSGKERNSYIGVKQVRMIKNGDI